MGLKPATVCILTYGGFTPYFSRCLGSVLDTTPLDKIELRLGFNQAAENYRHALERLQPATMRTELASDTLTRVYLRTAEGLLVRAWRSEENLYKEPMARLLYYDVPLDTEYVVWFDDDSFVLPGWWEELQPFLVAGYDYIGQPWWVDYLPGQEEMIKHQPWYRDVLFELREGRCGVHFMTGGFIVVRSDSLRQANFPDIQFTWKGDNLKQYGGDTLLGEIARQLGWRQASHYENVMVNVDLEGRHPAPRRGGAGRQFGSDVNVVIS